MSLSTSTAALRRDASQAGPQNLARLRTFVGTFASLLDSSFDEALVLDRGAALLRDLVSHDDWLPDEYAQSDPARYQQYLLHCDSRERFSVVSFVWGPGQSTPVHDHRVWGLVGVLRGAEVSRSFDRAPDGGLQERPSPEQLNPGDVAAVSPRIGDIHQVSNAYTTRTSISIHVYGGNIGRVERATYDAQGGEKRFVSGYANRSLPNLWSQT